MVASFLAFSLLAGNALKPAGPVKADLYGPYFVLNAEVNGKPMRLLVDSGAGLNVLTPAAADKLGIKDGQAINANGAGSNPVAAKLVSLDRLKIGDSVQEKPPAVVVPLPDVLETDGLVGYGFLSTFVTTFDYENSTLTFTKPDDFKAPSGFIETPLRVRGNIPEVQMTVDGVEGWVKVDTGSSDNLTLFDAFVESRELRERLPDVRPVLGMMGVGGATAADEGRIKGLFLAGMELPEMIISMSLQKTGVFADTEVMGNLGADILRRFTVIMDYKHGKAYFKKNKNFDSPQLYNRTGIAVMFTAKQHKVIALRPGSAGEKAGILVGEFITAVNGKSVTQMKALEVWAALRDTVGTKLKLKVKATDGKERDVELVLSDA